MQILYQEAIKDFNVLAVKKKLLSFEDKIELRKYVHDICVRNEVKGKEMFFATLDDMRKGDNLSELFDFLEDENIYDKALNHFKKKYELLNEIILMSQIAFGLNGLLEKGSENLENFVKICCFPSKPFHNQMIIKPLEFMRKRGDIRVILTSLSLERLQI